MQVTAAEAVALVFSSTSGSINGSGQATWSNVEITDGFGNPVTNVSMGDFVIDLYEGSTEYSVNLTNLGSGYYDITTNGSLSSGSGYIRSGDYSTQVWNQYNVSW